MSTKLSLELGALAKPPSEQLTAQGLTFDPETMAHLDRDAQAVSRLRVRGVIPWSAGEKAYDKLAKAIWKEVERANRVKTEPTQ